MIERDKKKENLQKNTKRITKEKELYDLLSKKQKITLKMLSTRTFHQKILNDIFTLSAEEIQECEGFEKNLAVSNAIKALFLLFVKELRNPMGKIENINTVFDKFFHLIHGYDKSKVLTSFIYRLFKDNKDSN